MAMIKNVAELGIEKDKLQSNGDEKQRKDIRLINLKIKICRFYPIALSSSFSSPSF